MGKKNNVVKLDMDGWFLPNIQARLDTVKHLTQLETKDTRFKKTKNGFHVYLYFKENLSDWQVLALQAILGSDWKREAINFRRLRQGSLKNWNVLFSEKIDLVSGEILSKEEETDKKTKIVSFKTAYGKVSFQVRGKEVSK